MHLGRSKNGKPVYTYFTNLNHPTWNRETLTRLADRLVISDDYVCPTCYQFSCLHKKKLISLVLIEGHMRLSIKIVGTYLSYKNNLKRQQDIISEAMLGIVDAVNKIKQGCLENHNFITAYIAKTVNGFISKFCCNDHTMGIPDRTYLFYKGKIKLYKHSLMTGQFIRLDKNYEMYEQYSSLVENSKALQSHPEFVPLEIREILEIISETEEDKLILKLKSEGRPLHEIATILELEKTFIFRRLKIMKVKFESLNNV